MLLANGAVAERLYETTPKSLLRSHKEPSTRILTQTSNQLEKFGVLLNYASAGDLHNSMCQYLPGNGCEADEFAAECRMMVINNLCARSMTVMNERNDFENSFVSKYWIGWLHFAESSLHVREPKVFKGRFETLRAER